MHLCIASNADEGGSKPCVHTHDSDQSTLSARVHPVTVVIQAGLAETKSIYLLTYLHTYLTTYLLTTYLQAGLAETKSRLGGVSLPEHSDMPKQPAPSLKSGETRARNVLDNLHGVCGRFGLYIMCMIHIRVN